MSILEKLNIKDLSDTKLRDEILRTEEQIKILKLTEKEYQGYLRMLEAERRTLTMWAVEFILDVIFAAIGGIAQGIIPFIIIVIVLYVIHDHIDR